MSLGLLAAMRGDIRSHRGNMTGSWIGLLGAFIGAVAVPVRHIPTFVVTEPAQAFAALVAVLVTTAVIVTAAKAIAGALAESAPQRRMAS